MQTFKRSLLLDVRLVGLPPQIGELDHTIIARLQRTATLSAHPPLAVCSASDHIRPVATIKKEQNPIPKARAGTAFRGTLNWTPATPLRWPFWGTLDRGDSWGSFGHRATGDPNLTTLYYPEITLAGAKRFPVLRRNPTEAPPDPALWGSFWGLLLESQGS
jgi:hypothetical protein